MASKVEGVKEEVTRALIELNLGIREVSHKPVRVAIVEHEGFGAGNVLGKVALDVSVEVASKAVA
jgi:hypothetical protein